jgi:hypothetical protein
MSTKNNVVTGRYGIVNLRKVAGVKTGEVNIQYALNSTDFASTKCQNGMLLVQNHKAKTLDLPSANTVLVGLVASVEKIYDSADLSLGAFALGLNEFNPRIYTLHKNDKFDANLFQYDDGTYADYSAIITAVGSGTVYGYVGTNGVITVTGTQDTNAVVELQVAGGITLPAGEKGLTFVVTKC